jgi:hypothetical protein
MKYNVVISRKVAKICTERCDSMTLTQICRIRNVVLLTFESYSLYILRSQAVHSSHSPLVPANRFKLSVPCDAAAVSNSKHYRTSYDAALSSKTAARSTSPDRSMTVPPKPWQSFIDVHRNRGKQPWSALLTTVEHKQDKQSTIKSSWVKLKSEVGVSMTSLSNLSYQLPC